MDREMNFWFIKMKSTAQVIPIQSQPCKNGPKLGKGLIYNKTTLLSSRRLWEEISKIFTPHIYPSTRSSHLRKGAADKANLGDRGEPETVLRMSLGSVHRAEKTKAKYETGGQLLTSELLVLGSWWFLSTVPHICCYEPALLCDVPTAMLREI